MNGVNLKTNTNIKLPLSFIIYALAALAFAVVVLFANSGELLAGEFRMPKIWMSAHVLLLGFALMTAMGAMYQLVPVTFLTPIWNQGFGYVQFAVTAVGLTVFALLLGYRTELAVYGAGVFVIGVLMFLFQMGMTLRAKKEHNVMYYFLISALTSLFLTITFGFMLVFNFAFGEVFRHVSVLLSHMTAGVAGWFTMLIMALSYKLVPMFSLSHGFSMKWSKGALSLYLMGLVALILSYWIDLAGLRQSGFLFLFFGFGCYFLDMKEILTKRMKKNLDHPFTFSIFAIINGLVIHFLAALAAFLKNDSQTFWSWLIFLYIFTWILFSIIGYLYKIMPFLWWTHKYSEKSGKEEVPLLKDLLNERLGTALFILFIFSVGGIFLSVALETGMLLFIGLGLLAFTSFLYGISVIMVLFK